MREVWVTVHRSYMVYQLIPLFMEEIRTRFRMLGVAMTMALALMCRECIAKFKKCSISAPVHPRAILRCFLSSGTHTTCPSSRSS